MKVGDLTYAQVKRRLELIEPSEPGSTTKEQRQFVGGEPVIADFRPGPGGWRQPQQLPTWTPPELDEYDEAPSIPIWLRPTTVEELTT